MPGNEGKWWKSPGKAADPDWWTDLEEEAGIWSVKDLEAHFTEEHWSSHGSLDFIDVTELEIYKPSERKICLKNT